MPDLRDFASFILHEHLDQLTRTEMELIRSRQPAILELFQHLKAQEQFRFLQDQQRNLLTALASAGWEAVVQERVAEWEANRVPGLPRQALSITQILHLYCIRKCALLAFLPQFTSDMEAAMQIVVQIDMYYVKAEELVMQSMERIEAETSERYRDLFDNANDMIMMARPDGYIMYANKAWYKTLGYSEPELIGRTVFDFIANRCHDAWNRYRQQALSDPAFDKHLAVTLVARDGREINADSYLSAKFRDGKPQFTRCIFRDVTSQRIYEEQLRFYNRQLVEREERMQQLIRHAPDAVIVIDAQSRIQLWNPKCEQVFGWSAAEVLQKELTEVLIPEPFREGHLQGMLRYLETGEHRMLGHTVEQEALCKDGSIVPVSITVSRSDQGGQPYFIAFLRDISQARSNEQALRQQTEELEHKNRDLEQYAWLTSHDLKEPLRKILTFSDLLLKQEQEQVSERGRSYLTRIHQSAQRMHTLIEAILSYSRVSLGQHQPFECTDLNQVIREVLSDLELEVRTHQAQVDVAYMPLIEADPVQMRQLFQNLISNAIKYHKPNEPAKVDVWWEPAGQGMIRIVVRDEGIGFQPHFAENIFKMFKRLVSREHYEGTGIGLALCRRIVEHHHGSISATGEDGGGATFTILLPVQQSH